MTKKLSERLAVLEEMGLDTSKYNIEINGNVIEIKEANNFVEDKQIKNKVFRRWITAQTFKMLNYEGGWDAYLRDNYSYMYQFTMMLEEIKTLVKIGKTDAEEFNERVHFFNKDVVVETCKHYLKQLKKYVKENWNSKTCGVYLVKYGWCDRSSLYVVYSNIKSAINHIEEAKNYYDVYVRLNEFIDCMNKLPHNTPKCSTWKNAFRGSGAYYSLKNMILYHDFVLFGCYDKTSSLVELKRMLDEFKPYEVYKFHYVLKDNIKWSGFDLANSIEAHK